MRIEEIDKEVGKIIEVARKQAEDIIRKAQLEASKIREKYKEKLELEKRRISNEVLKELSLKYDKIKKRLMEKLIKLEKLDVNSIAEDYKKKIEKLEL